MWFQPNILKQLENLKIKGDRISHKLGEFHNLKKEGMISLDMCLISLKNIVDVLIKKPIFKDLSLEQFDENFEMSMTQHMHLKNGLDDLQNDFQKGGMHNRFESLIGQVKNAGFISSVERIKRLFENFLGIAQKFANILAKASKWKTRKKLQLLNDIFEELEANLDELKGKGLDRLKRAEEALERERKRFHEGYLQLDATAREMSYRIIRKTSEGSLESQIVYLRRLIKYRAGLLSRFNDFKRSVDAFFSEEYIHKVGYGFLHIEDHAFYKRDIQQDNDYLQSKLNFYLDFKSAYDRDDQVAMAVLLRNPHAGNIGFDPPGNPLVAYAGVVPEEHFRGSWAYADGTPLLPEHFAGRLSKIMMEGYKSSYRQLALFSVGNVTKINNVHFYINPSKDYGGSHALVSWDCKDYCVFNSIGSTLPEYMIMTKHAIRPDKLRLYVRESLDVFSDSRWCKKLGLPFDEYQIRLKKALDKFGVKYTLIGLLPGESDGLVKYYKIV